MGWAVDQAWCFFEPTNGRGIDSFAKYMVKKHPLKRAMLMAVSSIGCGIRPQDMIHHSTAYGWLKSDNYVFVSCSIPIFLTFIFSLMISVAELYCWEQFWLKQDKGLNGCTITGSSRDLETPNSKSEGEKKPLSQTHFPERRNGGSCIHRRCFAGSSALSRAWAWSFALLGKTGLRVEQFPS